VNRFLSIPGALILSMLLAVLAAASSSAGGGRTGVEDRAVGVSEPDLVPSEHPDLPASPYVELEPIQVKAEHLYGIAVDWQDRIFVSADQSILVFGKNGESLGGFGLEDPALCLTVGPADLLYLGLTDHVQVYDHAGHRKAIWAGLGNEALITSIFATREEVFVADAGNQMVLRFDLGGRMLDYILGDGSDGPQLIIPSPYFDLVVTQEGTLWAANPGCHRVHCYTIEGEYLGFWGRSAPDIEAFCGCCNPTHLALTPSGSIVTSEKGIPRVKVYDSAGTFQALVAGPDSFAEGTVGLDVAVDSRGRVIVLDPKSGMVRTFTEEPSR
jgi:hypothetical protein